MIDKPSLECKYPVGNGVAAPEYAGATTIIPNQSADMSGGTGLNGTASEENLSARFKNPRVHQDIPDAARNQYQ